MLGTKKNNREGMLGLIKTTQIGVELARKKTIGKECLV